MFLLCIISAGIRFSWCAVEDVEERTMRAARLASLPRVWPASQRLSLRS